MALELRKITSIDNDPGFKSEVELRNTPELLDTPESYTDMMQYGLLNFPNIAKGFETKPGYEYPYRVTLAEGQIIGPVSKPSTQDQLSYYPGAPLFNLSSNDFLCQRIYGPPYLWSVDSVQCELMTTKTYKARQSSLDLPYDKDMDFYLDRKKWINSKK